jgi:hypothetical protein
MRLASRIEALEVRSRTRATRHVVIHQLPAGQADEMFGIAAEGPPIERQECGRGVLWLVIRRPPSGLTPEQIEAIQAVADDPALVVVSRLNFSKP